MKKRISALLLALFLLSALYGCTDKTPAPSTNEVPTSTALENETTAGETLPEPTDSEAAEVPEEYHWDLTAIYADMTAWEKDIQVAETEVIPALSAFAGKLNTEEDILAYLEQQSIADQKISKLLTYATLLSEQNQSDNQATAALQKVSKLYDTYLATTSFASPELLANPEEFLDSLVQTPRAEPYAEQIRRLREDAEHVLPEETEIMLLPVANAANGANLLFSKLTSADMKYPTIKDSDGKEIIVDEANYSMILTSYPDQEFRKEAREILLAAYGQYRNTFAQNMDNFVQAKVSLAHSHQYKTAKEASMVSSAVPAMVYDNLMAAVSQNLDAAHRNVTFRKNVFDTDSIYYSDLNYPLVKELDVSISYEEAQTMIIEALAPLGEEYQSNLQRAFDERWIDVYPAAGKSSGAFSSGLYGVHPYVLTNYTDDYNSASTLAHELGHAMHQYESGQNQKSAFNANPTSFTSEIASTTNELLLSDYMIKNAKTDEEKLYYLSSQLTTLNNAFFLQAMYAEFEEAAYQIVENGGSLTADVLEQTWNGLMQKYYGPDYALSVGEEFNWSRIPHFYLDHYVYQYATSIAAASSIAQRITSGEPGAVEAYHNFLRAGDSGNGVEIVKLAGVDMTSPDFADGLIIRYNDVIDQIEELLGIQEN